MSIRRDGEGPPSLPPLRSPSWRSQGNWRRGYGVDVRGIANPAARAAGVALCEAMYEWVRVGGSGPRPGLDLVREALRHNTVKLGEAAARALEGILDAHPDPGPVLLDVFCGASRPARAELLRALHFARDVLAPVVAAGLEDRAKLVRLAAARKADRLDLQSLLPRLRALAPTERDADVRDELELHVALMEDGYRVEPGGDAEYEFLWIRGGLSTSVPRAEIEARGLEAVVAHIIERSGPGEAPDWEEE